MKKLTVHFAGQPDLLKRLHFVFIFIAIFIFIVSLIDLLNLGVTQYLTTIDILKMTNLVFLMLGGVLRSRRIDFITITGSISEIERTPVVTRHLASYIQLICITLFGIFAFTIVSLGRRRNIYDILTCFNLMNLICLFNVKVLRKLPLFVIGRRAN